MNFALTPLFYLYIRSSLNPDERKKGMAAFYSRLILVMFYMVFQFIQPDEIKYNSYVETKHPDWGYLDVAFKISDDPLGIRRLMSTSLL